MAIYATSGNAYIPEIMRVNEPPVDLTFDESVAIFGEPLASHFAENGFRVVRENGGISVLRPKE